MEELFAQVADEEGVFRVESPYGEGGERLISSEGDSAGQIAYANVEFPEEGEFADAEAVREVILDEAPEIDGLNIELGGFIFAEFDEPTAELLGIAFAIVILIVAFGSVLAMGLPIGVALFGIGLGGALTVLASHVLTIPEFAPFIGVMIGLGVGIDYALLIITRYREQLHGGHDVRESIGIAMDTAGRSVAFAGVTVVISLLGMLLIGVPFVAGLAVSASVTVALTVAASLTLLPALIGFAGERIDLTRRRGLIAAGFVAVGLVGVGLDIPALTIGFALGAVVLLVGIWLPWLKHEVPHRPPKPRRETLAYRWSRVIQHRPWPAALAGTAILLVLAAPVIGLRLGSSDESNYPQDTTTKQAYDLLVEGFGKGFNGPLLPGRRRRRRGRRGGARPPSRMRWPPTRASPRSRRRSPPRTGRRSCGTSCPPAARRTRPRPSWSTGSATTCCPGPSKPSEPRSSCPARRPSAWTSPPTSRSASCGSSPPC